MDMLVLSKEKWSKPLEQAKRASGGWIFGTGFSGFRGGGCGLATSISLKIKSLSGPYQPKPGVRNPFIKVISPRSICAGRRPSVAARAAVYGALVPALKDKRVAKQAAKPVTDFCKYPGSERKIEEARQHILRAYAERLTQVPGEMLTIPEIAPTRAARTKAMYKVSMEKLKGLGTKRDDSGYEKLLGIVEEVE
jgi:hypothetical protein